ncbi:MAG: molybdopterin oxidoreductase family protein [Alphaproteobacteria bacterium]|nr:molybdopterin oxidoreductase family protein [Alphaproteobacteria bacterium]
MSSGNAASRAGSDHEASRGQPKVELSQNPADEIKYTTCYMCACRCGIKVYLKDGKVRYIEGNRDHPVNKGVLCGKGSAGIMQHYSPARLRAPMKRVGPRGSGEFKEISWEEALDTATYWLANVRATDPKRLAFFTGRDQSQSLTGYWALQYGTPNYAAHGGFCSVNMAAGGLYTIGGAFWEFGDPDWEHTKYFMLFGVAEDHASNPIKMGIGKLKGRGAKFVSINPVRTGYNAVADEWIGIRPGTDGLFVGALIHELFRNRKIDLDYLVRYTNASWLVIQDPGAADHGMFVRDEEGAPLLFDKKSGGFVKATNPDAEPAITGSRKLADGRTARPVFELMSERFLTDAYSPEAVEERTGVDAEQIRRIARELAEVAFEQEVVIDQPWTDWTGRRHEKMIGRPVSMHAMRGVSAHSNGFHTCRMIHILQVILGSIDCPGGFLYKPPYPKQSPPWLLPHGALPKIRPLEPLGGPHLGFPLGPQHLLLDKDLKPSRIDKGFSWDAPLSAHGLMHMVINNAANKDPYKIDVLFLYMANMAWNSSMNIPGTLKHLTAKDENGEYVIPKIIYSDAYYSEMVPYADLILPDTTYLERWDCISLLDRPISTAEMAADSIRHPVVKPDRDVRGFQEVLIDLGARLKLPGFVDEKGEPKYPGGYPDYIVNHERKPGIGPLAGWRGEDGSKIGRGEPNPKQLERYLENGSFFAHEIEPHMRYFRHANRDYMEWALEMGFRMETNPVIFQLYAEPLQAFRLAAEGHGDAQPPETHRERIAKYFDPLPFWYPPFEETMVDQKTYPLHAITQRPMHMYHSWGSQNAWLRQITAQNRLYIHRDLGRQHGIEDDDWVWVSSAIGRVKCQARLMDGVNRDTIWTWNAIGKRKGAWGLSDEAPESNQGFLLNHLISELLPEGGGGYRYSNSDPVTGQAAWFDLRVNIEKADGANETEPRFEPMKQPFEMDTPDVLSFGAEFKERAR